MKNKPFEKKTITNILIANKNKLNVRFLNALEQHLFNNQITKNDFAEKMGVSKTLVNLILSGEKKLNLNDLAAIELALNVKFNISLKFNETAPTSNNKTFDSGKLNHVTKKTFNAHLKLTPTENIILKLILDGFSSNEIARKLFLSKRTIENHRYRINKKVNSSNKFDLFKFALKQGIVSL